MPCIAEADMRPIVYRMLSKKRKPRVLFDLNRIREQEYYNVMFSESQRVTRKMPRPGDIDYEKEMQNFD